MEPSRFVQKIARFSLLLPASVKLRARRAALSQWEVTMIPDPSRHRELGRTGRTGRRFRTQLDFTLTVLVGYAQDLFVRLLIHFVHLGTVDISIDW